MAPSPPPSRLRIVRLQIQTRPLKPGKAPLREYRPEAIQPVDRLKVTERGCTGEWTEAGTDRQAVDVHHQDHPQSRNRKGDAGVTVMGTGDYARLRDRYGPHLVDGIAGESILVDAPAGLAETDFPAGFTVRTATDFMINFHLGRVAEPCVEFSRFCLGEQPSGEASADVRKALIDLSRGNRGYRAAAVDEGVLSIGDEVVLRS